MIKQLEVADARQREVQYREREVQYKAEIQVRFFSETQFNEISNVQSVKVIDIYWISMNLHDFLQKLTDFEFL